MLCNVTSKKNGQEKFKLSKNVPLCTAMVANLEESFCGVIAELFTKETKWWKANLVISGDFFFREICRLSLHYKVITVSRRKGSLKVPYYYNNSVFCS